MFPYIYDIFFISNLEFWSELELLRKVLKLLRGCLEFFKKVGKWKQMQ